MAARFVAYVYPGWHADPYRPGIDEWQLLESFQLRYPGHRHPARPVDGPYDDDDPATTAGQIELARAAGIEAFSYFMYRGADGFVMDQPMRHCAEFARAGEFSISATWCVRLPHDTFPVPYGDRLDPAWPTDPAAPLPLADRPIQQLTLRDFAHLIDGWDDSWLEVPLTPRLRRRPVAQTRGADAAPVDPTLTHGKEKV
jgi:hypothetical protein